MVERRQRRVFAQNCRSSASSSLDILEGNYSDSMGNASAKDDKDDENHSECSDLIGLGVPNSGGSSELE